MMLIVFFDRKDMVPNKIVARGQTVKKDFDYEELKPLRKKVRHFRSEICHSSEVKFAILDDIF